VPMPENKTRGPHGTPRLFSPLLGLGLRLIRFRSMSSHRRVGANYASQGGHRRTSPSPSARRASSTLITTAATPDDCAITRQLVDAGRLLDIPVYDLVLGAQRYLSFAEAALL
jgi:RadC-like JAB domain-containing protein